jgi:predicted anti-sigma-YlaC factor YlaD
VSLESEHLHPNRGWALIREGGSFTPHEINHLEECNQCSEWLSVFGELSSKSGSGFGLENPFYVAVDEHVSLERGSVLIREGLRPTAAELGHLQYCQTCNEWLTRFAESVRKAGFDVTLKIPPYESPQG